MTNSQIIQKLREASSQKKVEYIVHSVRAKLSRKAIKESLFRGRLMSENITASVTSPGSTGGRTLTPGDISKPGVKVSSAAFAKYDDPEQMEDDIILNLGQPRKGTDRDVVFFTGKGPGTYHQMFNDLQAARQAAQQSRASAMTADDLIAAMRRIGDFTPEEQANIRRNARAYVLGFEKDRARLERGAQ